MLAIIIGHTQDAPGACNASSGVCEYAFNQPIAYQLAERLRGKLETTIVYRGRPNDYANLPAKVNRTGAHLALSLHANAFNTRASGTEMLYWHRSRVGKPFAEALQRRVLSALHLPDRGAKPVSSRRNRGGPLLYYTHMPCVIAEPFFIDNDSDFEVAQARLDRLVLAYADAVLEVLT
ncbi:MAG: hypothetical protein RhofKO_25980 [Rhodothermales bacterium]